MIFQDRAEAGQRLASELQAYRGSTTAIVLALPRGGVVVGYELAQQLGLPLDVIIVRKLGAPGNPELGIGALAEVGEPQLDWPLIRALGVSSAYIQREVERQRAEIERRRQFYRGGRPLPSVQGQTAIVVDDGAATGYTMLAALRALASQQPARRIAALPVCPTETVGLIEAEADQVVALATPEPFGAVGIWYRDFEQVSDQEVRQLLAQLRVQARGA
ncbi:MAG: phosphoribosyltransferase [Chloroflexi bacterium]|nr:phosphoribosyltransferase [Chloroflexota bacterium]